VAAALVSAGCGGPPARPTGIAAAPAPGQAVAVTLVDHACLLEEVARHRGKIVVLDCWSTSCPPCVKEFPGLVRLAAAHRDRVVCLSLAVDYDGIGDPAEFLPPVRTFLEKIGAGGVINMLSREEADAMYRKLDLVSVPAIYVWKPDGVLAIRYDDEMAARELGRPFCYADVERTVADLLAP